MAFEHKDNSGSLFDNDRKETDNHPDYKGSCKIDGVEYWISSWLNDRPAGDYQSLKFQLKDAVPGSNKAPKKLKKVKESASDEHARMTGGGDKDTVADDEISDGLSKEFDDDVPF